MRWSSRKLILFVYHALSSYQVIPCNSEHPCISPSRLTLTPLGRSEPKANPILWSSELGNDGQTEYSSAKKIPVQPLSNVVTDNGMTCKLVIGTLLQITLDCKIPMNHSSSVCSGSSKENIDKFSEKSSVGSDGLCIGSLSQWAKGRRENLNMLEIFLLDHVTRVSEIPS